MESGNVFYLSFSLRLIISPTCISHSTTFISDMCLHSSLNGRDSQIWLRAISIFYFRFSSILKSISVAVPSFDRGSSFNHGQQQHYGIRTKRRPIESVGVTGFMADSILKMIVKSSVCLIQSYSCKPMLEKENKVQKHRPTNPSIFRLTW